MKISVYVTNLGKYNEGELVGEWLDLPYTESEYYACLNNIGIDEEYEEFFITDYDSDIDIDLSEYTDLEELNDFIDSLDAVDDEIIECLVENGYDWLEIPEEADKCIIYADCKNTMELGYALIKECEADILDWILPFINYEKYGREAVDSGNFYFTSNGKCVEYAA